MMDRREFIKAGSGGLLSTLLVPSVLSCGGGDKLDAVIDRIELFRYDINTPRYFSFGTWLNRQHVYMKISAGAHYGWSEVAGSVNNPDLRLVDWSEFLIPYKGKSISEAISFLRSFQHSDSALDRKKMEFVDMGLLDLAGRVQDKPSIDMLQLKERNPVPGLFCILDKDLENVRKNAESSVRQNLSAFMKIKMYGDLELDMQVLKTVREVIGEKAYVLSDVNRGYKDWKDLDELAGILLELRDQGLNGVEDPAHLSRTQWIELQSKVGDLDLIPDESMRPAWEALDKDLEGMGRVYNIHPACMGSIRDAAKLGLKIRDLGAGLMVGDDSLTGPACTAWQQIAIGAGASWVEAIEKVGDSDGFMSSVESSSTYRDENGRYACKPRPGFGLELNETKLKEFCSHYHDM